MRTLVLLVLYHERTRLLLLLSHERTGLLLLLRHELAVDQGLRSLSVLEDGGRGCDLGNYVLNGRLASHEEPDEVSRLKRLDREAGKTG